MSDAPTRVQTASLDDQPPQPIDEASPVRHNQQPSEQTMRIKALNLEITKATGKPMTKPQRKMIMMLTAVAVVAGIGTGFGAFKLRQKAGGNGSPAATQQVAGDVINAGDVFGVKDDQTFKDSAEGFLAAGGVDGEGSHSLLREGGPSQTVYLTSSITDLDKMVGMKVKVWGETFKGQKAGWLMDVGRIQVIEVEAQSPVEAAE